MTSNIPIITIDGLSGSGKTTVSRLLSEKLEWYLLDSGVLYRALAYLIHLKSIDIQSPNKIYELLSNFELSTKDKSHMYNVIYKNEDISGYLYGEEVGEDASKIAKIQFVRDMLLPIQHACHKLPGLIANGRDMGTKVFPGASLKIFFIADVEIRAKRRHKELLEKGKNVEFNRVLSSLKARDDTDQNRSISPLKPADDAQILDSSHLNIESVLDKILELYTISRI